MTRLDLAAPNEPAAAFDAPTVDIEGTTSSENDRGLGLRQIRARAGALSACAEGTYATKFTVEPEGRVTDIRVRGEDARCVIEQLRTLDVFARPVRTKFLGRIHIVRPSEVGLGTFDSTGSGPGGGGMGSIGIGRPDPKLDADGVFRDTRGAIRVDILSGEAFVPDRAGVRQSVGARAPALLGCWDEQRPYSESLSDPLVVDLLIVSGSVADVRVATKLDDSIDPCVVKALYRAGSSRLDDTIARVSLSFAK